MKLGVDIYTIRSQGWDAYQILDYCAGIGLNLVHFSDLNSFASTEDGYLRGPTWIEFDSQLAREARLPKQPPLEFARWSKDGQTILRLHDAITRHTPQAKELTREVLRILSESVGSDKDADFTAFPIRFGGQAGAGGKAQ